jgi:ESCRT-II complex subunit VPS36
MRSSPKITLSLGRPTGDNIGDSATANTEVRSSAEQSRTWTCDLCGFVNSLNSTELSASASSRCNLCGVNYGVSSRNSSLPTSRSSTLVQQPPALRQVQASSPLNDGVRASESTEGNSDTLKAGDAERRIPCPACTFLNHPKLPFCEICCTALPSSRKRPTSAILSSPAPGSPTLENGNPPSNAAAKYDVVRLSFRKGGVQEAYRRLKNILSDKAWERQVSQIIRSL